MSLALLLRAHLWGFMSLGLGLHAESGCGPSPRPSPAGEEHAMTDTVTLSNRSPRAELLIPPFEETAADVLILPVVAVSNPARRPVELAVSVGRAGGDQREAIGSVALFPADRPARFALRVPPAAGRLLAARPRDLRLVIELLPEAAGVQAQELRVTIGDPEWQPAKE
jgi:hypothetical protein